MKIIENSLRQEEEKLRKRANEKQKEMNIVFYYHSVLMFGGDRIFLSTDECSLSIQVEETLMNFFFAGY